jgi:hypothetical protein
VLPPRELEFPWGYAAFSVTAVPVSVASALSLLARMVTIWAKGMKKADGVAGLTRKRSAMRLAASSLSIQMPEASTPTRVTVSSLAWSLVPAVEEFRTEDYDLAADQLRELHIHALCRRAGAGRSWLACHLRVELGMCV